MNWGRIILLTACLFFVPVVTIVVFTYGWSNKPQSWAIIWFGSLLALPLALARAFVEEVWMDRTWKKIVVRVITHLLIFGLSAAVIIYGWGMQPQRWWVIVGGYLAAAFLPPFNKAPGTFESHTGEKI